MAQDFTDLVRWRVLEVVNESFFSLPMDFSAYRPYAASNEFLVLTQRATRSLLRRKGPHERR